MTNLHESMGPDRDRTRDPGSAVRHVPYLLRYSTRYNDGVIMFPKIVLIIANSAAPGEMQHDASFHLGIQCLPMYPFMGFQYTKLN